MATFAERFEQRQQGTNRNNTRSSFAQRFEEKQSDYLGELRRKREEQEAIAKEEKRAAAHKLASEQMEEAKRQGKRAATFDRFVPMLPSFGKGTKQNVKTSFADLGDIIAGKGSAQTQEAEKKGWKGMSFGEKALSTTEQMVGKAMTPIVGLSEGVSNVVGAGGAIVAMTDTMIGGYDGNVIADNLIEISNKGTEAASYKEPSSYKEGDTIFNKPSLLVNPEYISRNIGEQIPNILAVAGGGIPAIGAIEAGSFAKERYNEQGGTLNGKDVALSATIGVINGYLEKIGFDAIFGKNKTLKKLVMDRVQKKALQVIAQAGISAITEMTTEYMQEVILVIASKIVYDEGGDWAEVAKKAHEQGKQAASQAVVVGGVIGAGASIGGTRATAEGVALETARQESFEGTEKQFEGEQITTKEGVLQPTLVEGRINDMAQKIEEQAGAAKSKRFMDMMNQQEYQTYEEMTKRSDEVMSEIMDADVVEGIRNALPIVEDTQFEKAVEYAKEGRGDVTKLRTRAEEIAEGLSDEQITTLENLAVELQKPIPNSNIMREGLKLARELGLPRTGIRTHIEKILTANKADQAKFEKKAAEVRAAKAKEQTRKEELAQQQKIDTEVGLKSTETKKAKFEETGEIAEVDRRVMRDFTAYVAKEYNPGAKLAHQLEIDASKIAERYNFKRTKTNTGLASEFGRQLEKQEGIRRTLKKEKMVRPGKPRYKVNKVTGKFEGSYKIDDSPKKKGKEKFRTKITENIKGEKVEEALARKATAKEKAGGVARSRGFNTIPKKKGYEVVYKPYGEDGAGYYYSKKVKTTEKFRAEDIESQISKAKSEGKSFDEFVESQGEPVFHGSDVKIKKFDTNIGGLGEHSPALGRLGTFFTDEVFNAKNVVRTKTDGGKAVVNKAYLNFKKPKIYEDKGFEDAFTRLIRDVEKFGKTTTDLPQKDGTFKFVTNKKPAEDFKKKLLDEGYDGIFIKGGNSADGIKDNQWIALKNETIKTKSQLKKLWDKKEQFRTLKEGFKKATGIALTNKDQADMDKLSKDFFDDMDVKIVGQILANKKALGSHKAGMIKIVKGQADKKATFFHEAVHKYLNVFTTIDEMANILVEAQNKYKADPKLAAKHDLNDFSVIEELIAEDFIAYAKSRTSITGKLKAHFERILSRIKVYQTHEGRINKLYADIATGQAKKVGKAPVAKKAYKKSAVQTKKEATKKYIAKVAKGQATKPSKIAKSIEAKAIEAKLTEGFSDVAGYDPLTIKAESEASENLINTDIEMARSVLRGEQQLPPEIRNEISLVIAMEEYIKKNPSEELAYELANSPLISASSVAGQTMRMARERTPDSATADLLEIKKAREAKAKKATKTTKAKVTKMAKEETSKINLPKADLVWDKFLNSITC